MGHAVGVAVKLNISGGVEGLEDHDQNPQQSPRSGRGSLIRNCCEAGCAMCDCGRDKKSKSDVETVLPGRKMGSIQKTGKAETEG